MKNIIFLVLILSLVSCKKNQNKITETKEVKTQIDDSKIGRNNYAVVWKWSTTNIQLVQDNWETISKEMESLWKEDITADVYYNAISEIDKFEYFPNISLFLKAQSYEEAEVILNKLTLVKKGIATYAIYPVGNKWLDRKGETIHEKGLTKSYITVWTTINKNKATDALIKEQADAILKLWNDGVIENVYFDIEGTQILNNKTDFVFFVNVNSEEEVRAICDKLPMVKENIASYEVHDVGVFWLGKFKKD